VSVILVRGNTALSQEQKGQISLTKYTPSWIACLGSQSKLISDNNDDDEAPKDSPKIA